MTFNWWFYSLPIMKPYWLVYGWLYNTPTGVRMPGARRKIAFYTVGFWIADRLPWFARKRLINILCGKEVMTDLMLSRPYQRFQLCMKW